MKPSRILHRFSTFSFGIVNVRFKLRVSYLGDITFKENTKRARLQRGSSIF